MALSANTAADDTSERNGPEYTARRAWSFAGRPPDRDFPYSDGLLTFARVSAPNSRWPMRFLSKQPLPFRAGKCIVD